MSIENKAQFPEKLEIQKEGEESNKTALLESPKWIQLMNMLSIRGLIIGILLNIVMLIVYYFNIEQFPSGVFNLLFSATIAYLCFLGFFGLPFWGYFVWKYSFYNKKIIPVKLKKRIKIEIIGAFLLFISGIIGVIVNLNLLISEVF